MTNENIVWSRKTVNQSSTVSAQINASVYITLICNLMILFGNPFKIDFLVRWGTRIIIVLLITQAMLFVVDYILNQSGDRLNLRFTFLVIATAFCFLINGLTNSFQQLVSYLCFLMLPAYGVLYRQVQNIKKLKKTIYFANCLYSVLFIWLYFSSNSHIFYGEYGIEYLDELTLGYGNPNETAMYLLISFFVMACAFFGAKTLLGKAVFIGFCTFLFKMIMETGSRACIILSIVATVWMITGLIKKYEKLQRTIVLLSPAVFAAMLILFPDFFARALILGEAVDKSRYIIYLSSFRNMNFFTYLFGDFSVYHGANLHNSYISIMAMFGLPVLIYYVVFLGTLLKDYFSRLRDSSNFMAYAGVMACILHGVAEAALLVSGTVYAGLFGLLFILMLPDEEKST